MRASNSIRGAVFPDERPFPGLYMTIGSFRALSERSMESGRNSGIPSSGDAKVVGAQGTRAVLGDECIGGGGTPG